MSTNPSPYLTLKETARLLRVSRSTVQRLRKKRALRAFRVVGARGVRVRRADAEALLVAVTGEEEQP
jgi:excisionase family DNA binding protein